MNECNHVYVNKCLTESVDYLWFNMLYHCGVADHISYTEENKEIKLKVSWVQIPDKNLKRIIKLI